MPPQWPALEPDKNRPRADFRPTDFRKFLLRKGLRLQWEMAARCPCFRKLTSGSITEFTKEKRPDCPACNGSGVIYHSSQEIRALVTTAQRQFERFAPWGENAPGMIKLSLLPEHLPTTLDRYTMLDAVMTYTEVRTRHATVEQPRYPIVTRTFNVGFALDPTEPEEVSLGVYYARRAGSDGVVAANVLEEGVDFAVTAAGEVDWTLGDALGTAPADGNTYSLMYWYHPVYVLKSHPYAFRDTRVASKATRGVETATQLLVHADCWLDYLGSE